LQLVFVYISVLLASYLLLVFDRIYMHNHIVQMQIQKYIIYIGIRIRIV